MAIGGPDGAVAVVRGSGLLISHTSSWDRPPSPSTGQGLRNAVEDGTADVVNGAASIGNALLNHPLDILGMVGGASLTTLGAAVEAAVEAAGVGLDITVGWAVIGVPANVVGAGMIGTGGVMAGAAAADLAQNAAGADGVTIMYARKKDKAPGSSGATANQTGYSRKQIEDAIQKVKNQPGWRGYGGNKNPDVDVDRDTGEVNPQRPDGGPSDDSIGNGLRLPAGRELVTSMATTQELDDRWILPLRGATLTAIDIGEQVDFVLDSGVRIVVGSGAYLSHGSITAPKADSRPLAHWERDVIAAGVGARVMSAVGFKSGTLRIVLSNGWHLNVIATAGPFVAAAVLDGNTVLWTRPAPA